MADDCIRELSGTFRAVEQSKKPYSDQEVVSDNITLPYNGLLRWIGGGVSVSMLWSFVNEKLPRFMVFLSRL